MKVIRVLSSGFKPGHFKGTIVTWFWLCIAIWVIGKLTGNAVLMWLGPISITLSFIFILWLVYRALDGKERKDFDCEDYLR